MTIPGVSINNSRTAGSGTDAGWYSLATTDSEI